MRIILCAVRGDACVRPAYASHISEFHLLNMAAHNVCQQPSVVSTCKTWIIIIKRRKFRNKKARQPHCGSEQMQRECGRIQRWRKRMFIHQVIDKSICVRSKAHESHVSLEQLIVCSVEMFAIIAATGNGNAISDVYWMRRATQRIFGRTQNAKFHAANRLCQRPPRS